MISSSLWQISYPFKVVNNLPIPLEYANTSFWYPCIVETGAIP